MPTKTPHSHRPRLRSERKTIDLRAGIFALAWMGGCSPTPDASGICPPGVDTTFDLMNCGTCGIVCNSGENCAGGECVCMAGERCDGVCVNTNTDPSHCGTCGTLCTGGLLCSNGSCKATCDPLLMPCGLSCVDFQTDASHCGGCGSICESGQLCTGGVCTCAMGRLNCGSGCTDVSADLLHCGGCDRPCGEGLVCQAGLCVGVGPGVGGGPGAGGGLGVGGSAGGASAGGGAGSGGQDTSGGGTFSIGGGASSGGAPGAGGAGSPGCTGKVGFYVDDGKLYDKNCNEFIMRGVNYPYAWYSSRSLAAEMSAMASVGANAVRIVGATGDRWTRTSGSTLTSIIEAAKAAKMIVVIEVHDTTGYAEQAESVQLSNATTFWTSSDIASALKGQEAYVIINIGNEPNGNDTSPDGTPNGPDIWAPSHVTAIQAIRGAGLHHALMVDAPNWGQDWRNTMRDGGGARIWDGDADKNIIFSVHMYDVYNSPQLVSSYFNSFLENYQAPLVVGEFAADHGEGKDVEEETIMALAESLGLGYLGWSWSGNGDGLGSLDITTDFNVSQLSEWGDTLVNSDNGLKATSEVCSVFD